MKNKVKKITCALMSTALVSLVPIYTYGADNVIVKTFTIDGQALSDGSINCIPAENLFECLGMEAEWDADSQCVYASDNETEVLLNLNSCKLWVNGECTDLNTIPFDENGMVFVSEQTVYDVLNCIPGFSGVTSVIISNGCITLPTAQPTQAPSAEPTYEPSTEPTQVPTAAPTTAPTAVPTTAPTAAPTVVPTAAPTTAPTAVPTSVPTLVPTAAPTTVPTTVPTSSPTTMPTAVPTAAPTSSPTTTPTTAPTTAPSTTLSSMEQQVLKLVNEVRAENGLSPLTWADDLANVARAHSQDMINRNFFSHTNPDGLSPFDRLKNSGISYRAAAENIAYGQKTAEAVMDAWMNSSGHRANILSSSVKELGVGAAKASNGTIYWTQVFVSR